jgi:hypothetical protein
MNPSPALALPAAPHALASSSLMSGSLASHSVQAHPQGSHAMRIRASLLRGAATLLTLTALATAAAATPAEMTLTAPQVDAPVNFELTHTTTDGADGATGQVWTPGLQAHDAGTSARFATATETMVWARRGRLGLGLGVEARWQAPDWAQAPRADAGDGRRLLLGLSVATSARTRLVWQTNGDWLHDAIEARGGQPGSTTDQARLPLSMQKSNPYRALLRGSLRVNLGGRAAVALKLRGRRVGVAYTNEW